MVFKEFCYIKRVFTRYECSNECECFRGAGEEGVKSGINGEEGACGRYYGVGLLKSYPLKRLA